jgi:hypothetical protein
LDHLFSDVQHRTTSALPLRESLSSRGLEIGPGDDGNKERMNGPALLLLAQHNLADGLPLNHDFHEAP